jgi:hypothetical protein
VTRPLTAASIALLALMACTTPAPTEDPGPPPASPGEAATVAPAPEPGVGIFPQPVSHYVCEDGSKLVVRLLNQSAAVTVNNEPKMILPQLSSAEAMTVFSNGRQSLTIKAGKVSWAIGRMAPLPCAGG